MTLSMKDIVSLDCSCFSVVVGEFRRAVKFSWRLEGIRVVASSSAKSFFSDFFALN